MFSATTTAKTEALTKLALKKEPIYIGVDDTRDSATVEGLEQGKLPSLMKILQHFWNLLLIQSFINTGYVVCPSEKRFLLLFTFLKKNRNKKIMVFFSSCMSVKFHQELLNYIDMPVMSIHVSKFIYAINPINFQFSNLSYNFITFPGKTETTQTYDNIFPIL